MSDLFESLVAFPAERWTILEALGGGAQGETFKARHAPTGAVAALKRLHARHAADIKQLELFFREAEVLKTLAHPAIPTFLDAFVVGPPGAARELYLAQSFVAGHSLDKRLSAGPRLGHTDVLALGDQLLAVLDYLHSRLPPVFHRDIKPSNVIVADDGRLALVDFGVVASGWRGLDATTIVGTPGYTAPEQFSGVVGVRTELYAVGALLAFVVTGLPPVIDPLSGQLVLPFELAEPLRSAILALAAPIPSARPASAAAARQLLVPPPRAVPPRHGRPSAPTSHGRPSAPTPFANPHGLARTPGPYHKLGTWHRGWLLALEPAPRSPTGTHASLYRRLAALGPRPKGAAGSPAAFLLWILTFALCWTWLYRGSWFWLVPPVVTAVAARYVGRRAKRVAGRNAKLAGPPAPAAEWQRLFIDGATAVGEVRAFTIRDVQGRREPTILYRFATAEGAVVLATATVDVGDQQAFEVGTAVLVLYHANDPEQHRVVLMDPADLVTPSVYRPFSSELAVAAPTAPSKQTLH